MSMPQGTWFRPTLTLIAGVVIGLILANRPPAQVYAGGNDRYGESISATGPVMVQMDAQKNATPLDAIYHLDYTGARLLGAIPSVRQSSATLSLIDNFAERDLMADFHLSTTGPRPHFQMITGSLGAQAQGMAALYVFETSTKQVGVYRITPQASGLNTLPRFELIQLKSFAIANPKG